MTSCQDSSPSEAALEEPLSARSSRYYSANETDTMDCGKFIEQSITMNGGHICHTSLRKAANETTIQSNNDMNKAPSPLRQSTDESETTSPTVRNLAHHQKRAVGSFMDSPSKSNWDELVRSMKRNANDANKLANGHNVRRLSFEPEQIHSIKDNPYDDAKTNNQLFQTAQDFAVEHGIFLKAILQLLHENEQIGHHTDFQKMPQTKFDDIQNVIKIGSLKKASKRVRGVWNVKFVEIRKGVFSYYGDNAANYTKPRLKRRTSAPTLNVNGNYESKTDDHNPSLTRKDIPLHALECTCRAVKLRSMMRPSTDSKRNLTSGAVFELRRGGRRHLLMANTNEERRHWIQAIHDAMIGVSVTRGDNFLEYQVDDCEEDSFRAKKSENGIKMPLNTPYSDFMEQYLKVRDTVKLACSKDEYRSALSRLRGEEAMVVPVEWIKSQFDTRNEFLEHEISSSVEQLWRDLCRDSVEINGQVLLGDAFVGPDRIFGALTRRILQYGGASNKGSCTSLKPDRITEAQAVSYARDILLASDRTRSGGDSYYCVEHLCLNREIVAICPTSVEAKPISISVTPAGFGKSNLVDEIHDVVCGWAMVRIPKRQWVRRFLILGRNILHCYAQAEPIPHQLREKFYLKDVVVSESSNADLKSSFSHVESTDGFQFGIFINDRQFRRDFSFDDEPSCSFWKNAFESVAKFEPENSFRASLNLHEMEYVDEDREIASLDALTRNSRYGSCDPKLITRTNPSAVDVEIKILAEYKVVTIDPQGNDCDDDTWAILRTEFSQKFCLSGGSRGRIAKGDEVVKLEML